MKRLLTKTQRDSFVSNIIEARETELVKLAIAAARLGVSVQVGPVGDVVIEGEIAGRVTPYEAIVLRNELMRVKLGTIPAFATRSPFRLAKPI